MRILTITASMAASGMLACAQASVIVSPDAATASSDVASTIGDTVNQSGLSTDFVSGVTDFDSYIAGGPTHTYVYDGFEWFSARGVSSATVTFDLGTGYLIDTIALWNEEASGIGSAELSVSTDGVNFTALTTFSPADNPIDIDYEAQLFSFLPSLARYVMLDMTDCPQGPSIFNGCAIGEVAFRALDGDPIPVPGAALLFVPALGGLAAARRRTKKA